jgi:IPT/TIG domain-containing protein
VAFTYFAVSFFHRGVLVDMPDVLLGLTGASAGTYVLNKTLQTNRPVIAAVEPSVISPGTAVTIRGRNLFPEGASDDVSVTIGGITTTGQRLEESITVAAAPTGMTATDATVSVTTAANVTTDKYPITIVDHLSIIGILNGPPQAGTQLLLRVEGLPNGEGQALVTFDATVVEATLQDGVVTVTSPPDLTGTVEMKLGYQGRWSAIRTMNFTS